MVKFVWKKYGKMITAAVFLTVAGLYCGMDVQSKELMVLDANGHPVVSEGKDSPESKTDDSKEETCESMEDPTESRTIYIHICGEVKSPGVYRLKEGSRIFEAVEAAGGFTEDASETSLNLAQPLMDGIQIVILNREEAEEKARRESESAAGIVNLNTASKEQLMTLDGIGEARAEDILDYREESGGFQTIEEIMKVPGIKESAYLKIKDSITV